MIDARRYSGGAGLVNAAADVAMTGIVAMLGLAYVVYVAPVRALVRATRRRSVRRRVQSDWTATQRRLAHEQYMRDYAAWRAECDRIYAAEYAAWVRGQS